MAAKPITQKLMKRVELMIRKMTDRMDQALNR